MAISQRGSATTAGTTTDTVTATKPTGTVSGDVLIAAVSTNNVNVTPPAGWTEFGDEVTDVFRLQCFYKVAGGSESASYAFTVASGGTPLIAAVTAWQGVDNADVFDIDASFSTALTSTEPRTTPSLSGTGATAGRLMYIRAVRDDTTTPITFTASGVTELADHGQPGGSVAYSQALYAATADYSGTGTKAGLAITASSTETHNITGTWALKAANISGPLEVDLPLLTMSADGYWADHGVLDADIPLPEVMADGFIGDNEGSVDTVLALPQVDFDGETPILGSLSITYLPLVNFEGESRLFAENVVTIEHESRWFIILQDEIVLARSGDARTKVRYSTLDVVLPLPEMTTVPLALVDAPSASVSATANQPSVAALDEGDALGGIATATATANSPTVRIGSKPSSVAIRVHP